MKNKQGGFVLVVSLIFLVIITMLAVFMFNAVTKDLQMAGNYREKGRAVDAAQAALNSAEAWLAQPNNAFFGGGTGWVTGANCTSQVSSTTPFVCANALANPKTLPWSAYSTYQPKEMTVATGQPNSYADGTKLYVQYLGATSSNPPKAMYQVTATARGGNANAVAVLKAAYEVTATSRDISQ